MENTDSGFVKFSETEDSAIYIALNAHKGKGVPESGTYQKSLHELIEEYDGPEIYLDFSKKGRLRGIEILGD